MLPHLCARESGSGPGARLQKWRGVLGPVRVRGPHRGSLVWCNVPYGVGRLLEGVAARERDIYIPWELGPEEAPT